MDGTITKIDGWMDVYIYKIGWLDRYKYNYEKKQMDVWVDIKIYTII